ncbi:GEVED domain-containing protein [Chryseobacterium joostei]|uniref:GEVED domain-containing protein n=1 Tax=Chryseobacterium joostei TaxID=112234 RepID=UPI003D0A3ABA
MSYLNLEAQGSCYTSQGCSDYSNFGYNSTTAAKLEYDNYVSSWHSTVVRDIDGTLKIWGEMTKANGVDSWLVPTSINASNYPGLTGKPLKVAMASSSEDYVQFILLTDNGKLWAWGVEGMIADNTLTTNTAFQELKNGGSSFGLPAGVTAADVKMMTAFSGGKDDPFSGGLAITTCAGNVYILAQSTNAAMRGNGTVNNTSGTGNTTWYQVEKSTGGNLTGIVSTRTSGGAVIALDNTGSLWTWGNITRLGDGTGASITNTKASQMVLPGGTGAIKMIGLTFDYVLNATTYYTLYENGGLYALGANSQRQIGDWTTTARNTWVQPRYGSVSGTPMNNIKWISPNENDNVTGFINVITNGKQLYNWGTESGSDMGRGLGTGVNSFVAVDPGTPSNFESPYTNSGIIAVESGGHTTMVIKECVANFGYAGHRIHGSMGDGSAANVTDNIFHFGTSAVQVCGVNTAPFVKDLKMCPATTVNLANAHIGTIPAGLTLVWYTTSNRAPGTQVSNPSSVGPGIYYAFYEGGCPDPVAAKVTISYYTTADPEYLTCSNTGCLPDPYITQQTWWLPNSNLGQVVMIDFSAGSAVLNNPATGIFGQGDNAIGFEGNTTVTHPVTKKVLFVTDGNVAYRYDGQKASGSPVGGHKSAGESAAVIPDPQGILGRDFIILGNNTSNTPGSLWVSKYNLSTNMIYGNTALISGASIYEGLEVIPHSNGTDYWILVNTTDQMVKSYLYSKTGGFNPVAVSSTNVTNLSGVTFPAVNSFISWDPRQPGTVLIARHNKVGLASFDATTGALGSWNIKVTVTGSTTDNNAATGYSAALSPNGRYLYYKVRTGTSDIKYLDLSTNTTVNLGTISSSSFGLKIAPDGKLYTSAGSSSFNLYVVTNTPDSPSTVNSTAAFPQFATGGKEVSLQLPNNIYWQCVTCQAGTVAPALANTNITPVPATIGDLIAQLSASNQPVGTVMTIHSGSPATDTNKLANGTAVVSGTTYYVSFYDGLAICYSPATAITVGSGTSFNCSGKIYSLDNNGEIRAFTNPASSGALGTVINTTAYPVATTEANALGYSKLTGKFYYVQKQGGSATNNTFISYDPISNTYQTLAGTYGIIYRGTVTNDGTGYYSISQGNTLKYYNIAANTWTIIANTYVDQNGNDLNTILSAYNGGDIAMDGNGDLWILAGTVSSPTAYIFRVKNTVPTTSLGATPLVLEQVAKQDIGNSPNGIAFSASGELLITNASTLFKMNNDFSIVSIGAVTNGTSGDLASCAYPIPFAVSDFGDAPDTYKTLLTSNGAQHTVSLYDATNNTASLMIGSKIDLENDGFPNANANGDDTNNINDENSVTLPILTTVDALYSITVPVVNSTGVGANIKAWIDFNKNGIFDAAESVTAVVANGATSVTLTWTGLSGLTLGDTYYRIRIAKVSSEIANPTGVAVGGEVEDGKITISAPSYCTKPGDFTSAGIPTKIGITNLQKQATWPESVPNGFIALESKTSGFVITRVAQSSAIADPKEGMIVYDIAAQCVKLYNGTVWKCIQRSCNN